MDLQQKSIEAIDSITVSYFADSYLNEDWHDMRWDIIDALSYIKPDYDVVKTKTVAFVVGENYYFASTIIYETPKDVVVYDVFDIDLNMFLEFVSEGMWVDPKLST